MMSMVTQLTRSIDRELIKKLFRKFSGVYGNLWNSRCTTPEDWNECVTVWLDGLKGFEFDVLRKAVTQSFIAHKDFPPTLGQLVDICLHVSGVPSEQQVIDLMVRKDFNHPLVKIIYDKVGSWAISTGKMDEITKKVCAVYSETLTWFRENTENAWAQLKSFNVEKALPPPLPKIPPPSEIISWRERVKQYEEKAKSEKMHLGEVVHPVWQREQLVIGGKFFDGNAFNEYKCYLLSLDDIAALTLPTEDRYDRGRFVREIEGAQHLQKVGHMGSPPEQPKPSSRGFTGPQKVYKNWQD